MSEEATPIATAPAPPGGSFDVNLVRQDFPVLRRAVASGAPLAYLDNASSTQHPRAVIDAVADCYERYYANVHRGIHTLSEESTERYERSRRSVAEFLGATEASEVIFTPGTTAGINLVVRSWGDANVTADDTVLLLISEHHANIVPWHQLSQRRGCRVEFVRLDDDLQISDQAVAESLDRFRPKLFGFGAVSNVLGTEYPVARWTRMAHDHGATVLIDAAQAAPHQPIDVRDWDADFVVFSGHKVCGPSGIGVLYGKRSYLDEMPPFLGGGAMIREVTTDGFAPAELPEKFEAGTPPIAQAIGLEAAVRYLRELGLDAIHQHEQELRRIAESGLRAIPGVRLLVPGHEDRGGIVSFTVEGVHAHDVAQHLDTRGIAVRAGHHCTMPLHRAMDVKATTRASFFLYNTPEEANRFVEAVAEVRDRFGAGGRRRRRR